LVKAERIRTVCGRSQEQVMSKSSIFSLFTKSQDDTTPVLDMLARNRTPVQVEVEKSLIRFKSQLSLKEKSVLLIKPPTLGNDLHKGGFVRLSWPGAGRREMRLEISAPHFNLPNGNVSFVCKVPEGSAMPKRKHDRYDTSHYTNMRLELGSVSFRLLDLCAEGCRIAITSETSRIKITLGRPVEPATLIVGKNSKVNFEHVTPRAQREGFIGCEFRIKQDGVSPQLFAEVLQSVQTHRVVAAAAH
jgi:hypothetical protein